MKFAGTAFRFASIFARKATLPKVHMNKFALTAGGLGAGYAFYFGSQKIFN